MIDIDTNSLREISKTTRDLNLEYLSHINKIFNRFDNMNKETGEWSGNSAAKFAIIANNDSLQYKRLATILNNYTNNLDRVANLVDSLCIEVKKK